MLEPFIKDINFLTKMTLMVFVLLDIKKQFISFTYQIKFCIKIYFLFKPKGKVYVYFEAISNFILFYNKQLGNK